MKLDTFISVVAGNPRYSSFIYPKNQFDLTQIKNIFDAGELVMDAISRFPKRLTPEFNVVRGAQIFLEGKPIYSSYRELPHSKESLEFGITNTLNLNKFDAVELLWLFENTRHFLSARVIENQVWIKGGYGGLSESSYLKASPFCPQRKIPKGLYNIMTNEIFHMLGDLNQEPTLYPDPQLPLPVIDKKMRDFTI